MAGLRGILTPPLMLSFVVFGTMPLWIEAVGLYQYLGLEIMIWVIFALGYNILLGYGGLPSFGHGAFLGVGAYAFGLTQFELVDNLWVALLGAVLASATLGGLVALFISHRRGIYYALMTIAFGQIFFFVASKWTSVTGGEDGLLNIQRLPVEFGLASVDITDTEALTWFAFSLYVVVVIVLWQLVNAPFGKILKAIKQNEARCSFLGYNVVLYKWAAFTISCTVAGLAGGLFAMAQQGAYIQIMSLQWSGIIVLMTLIGGGFVSFWGPVFGVVLYFVARDVLGAYTETWLLWFGLMFIAVVMFRPDGLAGIGQDVLARLRRRRKSSDAPSPQPAE